MAVKMMNLLLMLIVAVNVQTVYSSNRVKDIDMSMKNNLETEQYSKEFLKALRSLELYIHHESNKLDAINDVETDIQENDTIKNQKRPFVRGGASRGYKFGKRNKNGNKQDTNIKSLLSEVNLVDNEIPRDDYKFTDDSFNDFQINHAVKQPFVLRNFKLGKRSSSGMYPENDDAIYLGEPGYGTEENRPFVINSRQPFILHGFDFVKPRTNTDTSSNGLKRPLVLSSGYTFGEGQQEHDAYLEENKRPFVLSGGFGLKKRGGSHEQSLDSIPRYEENSHIVKRPFVMGGYVRKWKQPAVVHKNFIERHPMFIGSGFRFGKRGHWEGQVDGLTSNGIRSLEPNDIASLSGINENIQKSPIVLDNSYQVDNRPFIIYGGYRRYTKRPHIVRISLKQRDIPNTDIKRHHAMLFQGESQSFPLEITQKEPFGRTQGELFQDIPKRSFSFRNDYLFSKIRNDAKSVYRQQPFDQQIRAEKSSISNSPEDRIYFQSVKRPFTTSGNYKSRIGKRPFVLSGRRMRYKFGK